MDYETETQQNLRTSLFRALIPLASALLQVGVSYKEFEMLCKKAFVASASRMDGSKNRQTNTSRIAHMTGLSRRMVRHVRRDLLEKDIFRSDWEGIHRPGDILHGWYYDPEFQNPDGTPRKLSINKGFSALVKKYGGDIPVGAVRKELKRVNAIIEHSDGTTEPIKPYYAPLDAIEKLVTSLNWSLYALLSTMRHNSDPKRKEAGRLERFISSDRIPAYLLEEIRLELRRETERFSLYIDEKLSTYEKHHSEDDAETYAQLGVGVFYYEDDASN